MAMVYYYAMFGVSLLVVLIYSYIFHKHFDVNLTIMTTVVPIVNLGFVLMGSSQLIEEALIALRLTYLGGCVVLVAAMFLIFNVCGVKLPPWLIVLVVAISAGVFSTTLTIGHTDLFYKGIPDLAYYGGAAYITNKHYGPMHTVFYVMVGIYYAATVGVIIYSIIKKRQVPRSILILIIIAITVSVIGFFGGRFFTNEIELLPATYNIGMIIYLILASRLRLYDASDTVIDSLVQKGDTGFISFDHKMRYLGSNDTAKSMLPGLNDLIVDHRLVEGTFLYENIIPLVEGFEKNPDDNKKLIYIGEKVYLMSVNHLMIGHMIRGHQFLISDDTANQKYIKLIKQYNKELEEEVSKKTKSIVEMQDKLVLGMATMIEGRDNSTGGHIKRTSDCIRILVGEMKKDESLHLDEKFCNNLIKAAPMHDLGKIAVDDAILRKPGRFTPEEYEIMKTHAPEGARIVKQILDGTDDVEFAKIAVNVAHFHHERYDGKGYPDHLKGTEIPFEARIMSIADVYDALVSKRVYKESMSFEEANRIILEGMGTQFDPSLEKYYLLARPYFEEYYSNL